MGGVLKHTSNITFSSTSIINENFLVYDSILRKFLSTYKKRGIEYFLSITKKIENKRVLVIGETIVDEYVYTETLGKSAKESILSTLKKTSQTFAGGSIAAANHIADFCKKVYLVTGIGDENSEDKKFIKNNLSKNIKLCDVKLEKCPTTKKTRFIDRSYLRKMFEVYEMNDKQLTKRNEDKVIKKIKSCISDVDLSLIHI